MKHGQKTRRKLKFTPAWVEAVKPSAVAVEYRDAGQRGLTLRLQPSGRKTWIGRYTFAGRDRRYVLGSFPERTLAAARVSARGILALAQSGTDPQIERERLRVGVGVHAAVESWLADTKLGPASKWKGGLSGGSARSFMPHVRRFQRDLAGKKLVELTPKDVEKFVSGPQAAATRNRALTALRGLMFWAGRKGLIDADPTVKLGKERETERSRVLTDAELRVLVRGFDGTRYGRAVRLLALTALRRDEVLGARWEWLDADAETLTIPAESEKTGRSRGEQRRVALSPHALALLAEQRAALFAEGIASPYVFATSNGERPHRDALKPILYALRGRRSNGQPVSKDKRSKPRPPALPSDVTLHDVRRTIANTMLNRLGVAPHVVDHQILGHVRPKLARTYMPNLPLDEARAALTAWAAMFVTILESTAVSAPREEEA